MEIQLVDSRGQALEVFPGAGTKAEFKEYTNKISKKPDPMLIYPGNRMVHMSTAKYRWPSWVVQNVETGEIIKVPDLSPN